MRLAQAFRCPTALERLTTAEGSRQLGKGSHSKRRTHPRLGYDVGSMLGDRLDTVRICAGLLVGLTLSSCGSSSSDAPRADGKVGPNGGTLVLEGLTIEVPPGALDHEVTIAVTRGASTEDGYVIDGNVYSFSPAGLQFDKPIAVTFPRAQSHESSVFWTTASGDDHTFERLATTATSSAATAHPTHFSRGFLGWRDTSIGSGGAGGGAAASGGSGSGGSPAQGGADGLGGAGGDATSGVTCVVKRRQVDSCSTFCTCSLVTTIETTDKLYLVMYQSTGQLDAIGTDLEGVQDLYLLSSETAEWMRPMDAEKFHYSSGAYSTGVRTGNQLDLTVSGARGGAAPGGCESVPLIDVQCSGTAQLVDPYANP
jgi:hypothetical protein